MTGRHLRRQEYERAFCGSQFASMAPLFEHYGSSCGLPEVGGRVESGAEDHEQTMMALGLQSKREITRTKIRVRTAMAAQTREQGRYLGGRPPYGYRLADAGRIRTGPMPRGAGAPAGSNPTQKTAPQVKWMFAERLAGHSIARITRALNDAAVPCPSAADPKRNPHRSGQRVDAAHGPGDPGQPALHGPEAWNRQRTDTDLIDPANTGLGYRPGAAVEPARRLGHLRPPRPPGAGQRGGLHRRPGGGRPPRPGMARQDAATCWPGCWRCGACGRRLESAWSNGKPAYRCRHGYTSATRPSPDRPKNAYIREDQILPGLAALATCTPATVAIPGSRDPCADDGTRPGRRPDRPAASGRCQPHLRPGDPHHPHRRQRPCRRHRRPGTTDTHQNAAPKGGHGLQQPEAPAAAGGRARVAIPHARETAAHGDLTCPEDRHDPLPHIAPSAIATEVSL